ncbi:MAG: peptidase, partial [Mollicutes bacterium]|nr:peptidase [Mollicutes bacterium]
SVLTIKGYEALEKIADGKSTKIYLPSNLQALASTSEVLASAFKEEK